jgi:hypothetical protein
VLTRLDRTWLGGTSSHVLYALGRLLGGASTSVSEHGICAAGLAQVRLEQLNH